MSRKSFLARTINKINRLRWWFTRPDTQGVKALLVCKDKILLVRLTYYPNTWTFPGGGISKSETPDQAARRECLEEVGIEPDQLQLLGALPFNHEYKKDVVHIFLSELQTEISPIIDSREIAEARWFSFNNLPNLGKNAQKILDLYKSRF